MFHPHPISVPHRRGRDRRRTRSLANLCYSLGPMVDVAIHRRWGSEYAVVGPTLFRYGFVFSVGLALSLPVPLAAISWVARLFF